MSALDDGIIFAILAVGVIAAVLIVFNLDD